MTLDQYIAMLQAFRETNLTAGPKEVYVRQGEFMDIDPIGEPAFEREHLAGSTVLALVLNPQKYDDN